MIRDFYDNQGLDLSKSIASITDGAPAMLGKHSGVGAQLTRIAPNVSTIHCMIHSRGGSRNSSRGGGEVRVQVRGISIY